MSIQWYGHENKEAYKSKDDFVPKNQKYKYAGLGSKKTWGGVPRVNGEITEMISPYRLQAVKPFLQKMPKNFVAKTMGQLPFAIPGIAICGAAYVLGNSMYKAEQMHHRD